MAGSTEPCGTRILHTNHSALIAEAEHPGAESPLLPLRGHLGFHLAQTSFAVQTELSWSEVHRMVTHFEQVALDLAVPPGVG